MQTETMLWLCNFKKKKRTTNVVLRQRNINKKTNPPASSLSVSPHRLQSNVSHRLQSYASHRLQSHDSQFMLSGSSTKKKSSPPRDSGWNVNGEEDLLVRNDDKDENEEGEAAKRYRVTTNFLEVQQQNSIPDSELGKLLETASTSMIARTCLVHSTDKSSPPQTTNATASI